MKKDTAYKIGAVFLALLFWHRLAKADLGTVWRGLLIGAVFIATMACELMGLRTSESSRIAFLENSAFVFVPIYQAVLTRRLPAFRTVVSVLVTLAGIACLTLKDGFSGFSPGDLFGVASAMLYACAIIITDRVTRGYDAFTIGIVQVGGGNIGKSDDRVHRHPYVVGHISEKGALGGVRAPRPVQGLGGGGQLHRLPGERRGGPRGLPGVPG